MDVLGLRGSEADQRASEDQQVRRPGRRGTEVVDVSVIAATSEDLGRSHPRPAIPGGGLVPSAGDPDTSSAAAPRGGEDAVLLAEHFLARACDDDGR
jgi:hypothetical protein